LTKFILCNIHNTNTDDEVNEKEKDLDAAWRHEIRLRVDEIKSGKVKMIPAEDM